MENLLKENSIAFYLDYGTIVYQPRDTTLGKEKIIPEHFLIFNSSGARPIQLYRRQILELIRQLPKAYLAFKENDTSFCVDIVANETQRISLDVSDYNNQTYLFLKKRFKPKDKANDPDQDWIYTRSNVSFNPNQDHAVKILEFVLSCHL
jgi:hypothetical protein